jgi:hypothetical protein
VQIVRYVSIMGEHKCTCQLSLILLRRFFIVNITIYYYYYLYNFLNNVYSQFYICFSQADVK